MMKMETKNWTQIIVLVGCILGGIVTGTIITAHHFGKMGGRAFPEFIFCATAGVLIASIIKYFVDKRKGINTTTSKLTLAVSLCVIVGLLIGAGIGYHYFFKPEVTPSNGQSTKIEPTEEMVEKIVFYENGEQEIVDPKSEEGKGIASLLTRKLHELNLQARCVFSEEDIREIKQKDRVAELIFKKPVDITISQWVEPEERYHIPVDENGYRILENVETAIFILEDNQERGLEAHILVGHRVEGRTGYSCWAINIKEGKPELDKSWIDEINRLIKTEEVTQPEISIESEKEEKPEVTLISVYDNYQVNPELKTAWGFATIIKTPQELILFDTGGNSEILLSNMKKLGIDPSSIKKVVISHIHGDHLGGLEGFLERNSNVTVFIPSSFPKSVKNMIIQNGAKFVEISAPRKISDSIYTTGELYGPPEEQSLIIDSKKGLVVITGCAHPGIVNIVKRAKKLMKKDKVYLVLGGFHHPPLSCVKEFKELQVEKVAPSHCTGDLVREAFRKEYKGNFIEYGVGKNIEIK